MVIWVTGMSCSGKTTLCNALWATLKPNMPQLVLLDGDAVRAAFGDGLGYREVDRVVQITRIQKMAKMLSDQNLVVLVAALYANTELLAWNRENIREYFEIYLKASPETVRQRDNKGLYSKADSGAMKDVVGVDIPWHEPQSPNLIIDCDAGEDTDLLASRVLSLVPELGSTARVK
jgi:adenylylsulfate kinase-like enzyme